jgi:hypothetical protein
MVLPVTRPAERRGAGHPFGQLRNSARERGVQYATRRNRVAAAKFRGVKGKSPTTEGHRPARWADGRQNLSHQPDHPRHTWLNAFLQNTAGFAQASVFID